MKILPAKLLLVSAMALALSCTAVYADDKVSAQEALNNARQEAQIHTTFALSPYLRAHDLKVQVRDGKAVLSGYVAEEVNKELAGAIASGVEGVKSLDNRIVVDANYQLPNRGKQRGYGEVVSDASINAAIKSKLIWSKYADGMDLTVTTEDGNVVLAGNVATAETKQLAEKLARDTHGVRTVKNQLKISDKAVNGGNYRNADAASGTMMADSWITTKVKSSLLYSRNVSGFDIGVNTDKGVVTLDGTVSSGAEKALATELAHNIRGVKSVDASKVIF